MSKRTTLDRRIVPVLPKPEDTASRRDGISAATERYHRLHGTSLLLDAAVALHVSSASCYATSCVLFHRFYYQVSLQEVDVWSAAMGSFLLAVKIEELTISLKQVIATFIHIYRQRKTILWDDDKVVQWIMKQPSIAYDSSAALPYAQKDTMIRENDSHSTSINPFGPLWKEWHEVVIETENKILRALGFTIYWIPDRHPHKFILYVLRVLEVDSNKGLAQSAWNFCNDSCRLDLCVRFEAHLVACAAIRLAASEQGVMLPDSSLPTAMKWWEVLCGPGHETELDVIQKELLALKDKESDVVMASVAFVKSLVKNESFNGPQSFSWESIK
ncbi:hypothetical protein FisN_15Lh118 [Fistulifera solaris]|uniref:Cyclin N-terminal domain-containing protein n=1 Tax=Fistulifera solaris TaxID=1519565 RepID=A0A1Z5KBY1_FISSO|nr:hypothetical protein FisN_15Lh118 [Fistulifera solaris]|eukprot:GAX23398.1 hypothetical protein FisN_15Lh118 [Fistulifera solaris]